MRRRDTPIPHREFFHAVTIDETVGLSCTCNRGVDHWYAEPAHNPHTEGTRLGARAQQDDASSRVNGEPASIHSPSSRLGNSHAMTVTGTS
ncbi:hypothetical protein [Agromyces subbeticus]|uniref:hypothetical protein n=1 Tax=Agromyces subbeticus TaxID=293890 RepID=UPI0003B31B97|nr:hypothetical protein [Agromyces subbeticus]